LQTGPGANYSIAWDTTTAVNGAHTLTAVAVDGAGHAAPSPAIHVTVNNPLVPPVISAVNAGSTTDTSATISWITDKAADSQVAYGLSGDYGQITALNPALVTA